MLGESRNEVVCPISEDTRIWMENAMLWLMTQFGEDVIINTVAKNLSLDYFHNSLFDESNTKDKLVSIIASEMQIDKNQIQLEFFDNQICEVSNELGNVLFTQQYDEEVYTSGFYEKLDNGKYLIAVERALLKDTESLVATMVHEFGHIKLLGENRIDTNDEYLTDLTTVFFGFGIFTSNSAFKYYSKFDNWGYTNQGYFSQQEWGYALGLFAFIRNEGPTPTWIKYLTVNIRSDFENSIRYILRNKDKILI